MTNMAESGDNLIITTSLNICGRRISLCHAIHSSLRFCLPLFLLSIFADNAAQGHGNLHTIYASVEESCRAKGWDTVDLVIICGDFQVRCSESLVSD